MRSYGINFTVSPAHLAALQNLPLLEGVRLESIQMLAVASRFQRFKKRVVVFDCGQAPDGAYLVLEGLVALATPDLDGRLHTVELFGPGHVFGDSGLIWGSCYGVCATVIQAGLLMKIPSGTLLMAIQQDKELGMRFMGEHSRRIRGLLQRIGHYATDSSISRVACFLLSLPTDKQPFDNTITFPAAKLLIASMLNMSCEAFSRALRKLMDEGLIIVSGNKVTLLSRERLEGLLAQAASAKKQSALHA